MNTGNSIEPSGPQATEQPERKPAPPPKKTGGFIGWLALLVALSAIGLAAFNYRLITTLQSDTDVVDQLSHYEAGINSLQEKQPLRSGHESL